MNRPILTKVKAALQEAEELGGVQNDIEYVQLMNAVILECSSRIDSCLKAAKEGT